MIRFVVIFIVCIAVLFPLELLKPVDDYVIVPFTSLLADLCVWLIHLFDKGVVVEGKIVRSVSTGFAVSIERGCNGVEAVLILVSAILAFPAPWKNKLAGIALGFLAIQLLNLVRIISLFYLGQWNQVWFDWFHLYLWQALIILDALGVWLVWLRYLPRLPAGAIKPP